MTHSAIWGLYYVNFLSLSEEVGIETYGCTPFAVQIGMFVFS